MARLRILLAAVLAVSAVAVLAVPASASTPAANNAKFCKAAAKIGNTGTSAPDVTKLKSLGSQFKAAAKSAPPKVKKAMLKISSLFKAIGGKSPADAARAYSDSVFLRDYSKSVVTFITYQAQACSGT